MLTYVYLCPPLAVDARTRRFACRDEALELLERFRTPQSKDEGPPDADCFYDTGANVTLLHEGVRRGLGFRGISELLGYGANVGVQDPAGATPLHWAAQYCARAATGAMCADLRRDGHLEQVLDIRDISGVTALDEAEMAGCVGVAVLLAKLGSKRARHHEDSDCQRELVNAVLHSDAQAVISALQGSKNGGSDVDCPVAQHPQGWTLLHLATAAADYAPASNAEAMLAVLLAHGADASQLDNKEQPPLFLAVAADRSRLAAALLDAEPTLVNHQDVRQRTPLHHAALWGAKSVVKLLLKHNARLEVLDSASKTPLDYAMDEGHAAIAALLVPHDEEFDFKLPPNGGLIEGGGAEEEPQGDGHVILGGVLGGVASLILLCVAVCCARARRRAKVLAEEMVPPPKVIVDPMASAKPRFEIQDIKKSNPDFLGPRLGATVNTKLRGPQPPREKYAKTCSAIEDDTNSNPESLGPRLGATVNTELGGPQPPKVKKRLKSRGKKVKNSETNSEPDVCVAEDVVETTQVEEIYSARTDFLPALQSPALQSPSQHHTTSAASQKRARERLARRSSSQIYTTRNADQQASDVQELTLAIDDTPRRVDLSPTRPRSTGVSVAGEAYAVKNMPKTTLAGFHD